MDECQMDQLLENEREWRRHVVEQLERIKETQATMHAWNLVFRLAGGALFTILLTIVGAMISRGI